MLPQTGKKVVVTKNGDDPFECLKIVDVPIKAPRPHEVIIKNHYAGVNVIDVARMMGIDGWVTPVPFDFGNESIGEVVAVGTKVNDFAIGDRVVTAFPGNGYQEYSIIDRNFVGDVPALEPKYIGLYISGAIARIALNFVADIQAEEIVFVTSAMGASGHFAVQLAKAEGCHVIGACRNAAEADILRKLGADRVIIRGEEDVSGVLAAEYHDRLDVVFDTMGGDMLNVCIEHTAPRARILLIEALSEHIYGESAQHMLNLYHKLITRSVSLIGINPGDYANAIPIESLKLLDQLQQGLIQSLIDPQEFEGLASVPDAIAHLMSGESYGKVIVKV